MHQAKLRRNKWVLSLCFMLQNNTFSFLLKSISFWFIWIKCLLKIFFSFFLTFCFLLELKLNFDQRGFWATPDYTKNPHPSHFEAPLWALYEFFWETALCLLDCKTTKCVLDMLIRYFYLHTMLAIDIGYLYLRPNFLPNLSNIWFLDDSE